MTNKFNEYMIEMLLEQVASKEMKLYFSTRFKEYIESIEHPISKRLLDSENKEDITVKKTYIDFDDNDMDKITFIYTSKVMSTLIDSIGGEDEDDDTINYLLTKLSKNTNSALYNKNRSSIKVAKFINQLFPDEFKPSGEPGNDMESFVNIFKSKRAIGIFELVDGEDIVYWYNGRNYSESGEGGSLYSSCMKMDKCEEYTNFYEVNKGKVSLLILKDDKDGEDGEYDNKIIGRALVWNLDTPDRMFMDRIYTFADSDVVRFKEYAKEKGWLYKSKQTMWADEKIGRAHV